MSGEKSGRPSQGNAKSDGAKKAAPASQTEAAAKSQRGRLLEARQAHFARSFSNIVAVMMRDPGFRNLRLADLEWLVLPAIMAGQWRMAQSPSPQVRPKDGPQKDDTSTMLVPTAVALWARVSPAIDERLTKGLDKPMVLRPNEWVSGDRLWLVATAGDPRVVPGFLKQLHETVFAGKTVKLRSQAKSGPAIVTLEDLASRVQAARKVQAEPAKAIG